MSLSVPALAGRADGATVLGPLELGTPFFIRAARTFTKLGSSLN
jgi:hypothetical protein